MQRVFVPMIGIPGAEDIVNAFLNALRRIFGDDAKEAVANALNKLKDNVPVLDLDSATFERYDGMFALALAIGFVAVALQLIRVVKLGNYESVFDAVKIVPLIYFFGATLPYLTSMLAGVVGDAHRGIIGLVTGQSADEAFKFSFKGDFGFFSWLFGWIGGSLLNVESEVMIKLLPQSLLVIVLLFGLRWFGFMGDGLFVIFVGIGVTMLVGSLGMVLALSLFYMGGQESFGSSYVVSAVFCASVIPLAIFWAYFKFGFSQKVSGVMETRQLNTAISARTTGNASSGGLAGKLSTAGLGALAGALYARSQNERDPSVSRGDHMRNSMSDRMMIGASVMSKTNPLATAALLMGSRIVKPTPKPDRPSYKEQE